MHAAENKSGRETGKTRGMLTNGNGIWGPGGHDDPQTHLAYRRNRPTDLVCGIVGKYATRRTVATAVGSGKGNYEF